MDAAVIKFKSLSNAIRATADNYGFFSIANQGFTPSYGGRIRHNSAIKISRLGGEFPGTGINASKHRTNISFPACVANGCFRNLKKVTYVRIRKPAGP